MSECIRPPKIDIQQATHSAEQFSGHDLLLNYERLAQEAQASEVQYALNWAAQFSSQTDESGAQQSWLHLQVDVTVPQICQRCLQSIEIELHIDRSFRFVTSESEALEQDDESEEDLLVSSRAFDLVTLIEDEVLMDLPLVPRHETCPVEVKLSSVDADFVVIPERPSAFAVLSQLKTPKSL